MDVVYGAIFYLLALIVLVSTVMAVTRGNQVHAVVYLVVSFFGTAALFYLLGAPLPAALEVIIYAGAIMVLFLFIIMTTRIGETEVIGLTRRQWIVPGALATISLAAGGFLIFAGPRSAIGLPAATASPIDLGRFLFEKYWYPVEIVSFLLLVALVGALYLGKDEEAPPAGKREESEESL